MLPLKTLQLVQREVEDAGHVMVGAPGRRQIILHGQGDRQTDIVFESAQGKRYLQVCHYAQRATAQSVWVLMAVVKIGQTRRLEGMMEGSLHTINKVKSNTNRGWWGTKSPRADSKTERTGVIGREDRQRAL